VVATQPGREDGQGALVQAAGSSQVALIGQSNGEPGEAVGSAEVDLHGGHDRREVGNTIGTPVRLVVQRFEIRGGLCVGIGWQSSWR
jgi:hypothetical protein